MRRAAYPLVLTLAALALAAPAQAKQPRHRMTFEFAALVAVNYWQARGVHIPCHPTAKVLTIAEDDAIQASIPADEHLDMFAIQATCTIVISPDTAALRTDRDLDWYYCMDVAHELGHLGGLDHDYGGVMNRNQNITPRGCLHPREFLRSLRCDEPQGGPSQRHPSSRRPSRKGSRQARRHQRMAWRNPRTHPGTRCSRMVPFA